MPWGALAMGPFPREGAPRRASMSCVSLQLRALASRQGHPVPARPPERAPLEVACPPESVTPGLVPPLFGAGTVLRRLGSLDAVHAAVAAGDCALGLLPLECSEAGPVNRSHDLLYAGAVQVVGEQVLTTAPGARRIRGGIIAPWDRPPLGRPDRLMLAALLPQRTGTLVDFLAPFARRGLSIAHWCARPARIDGWHYRFHFTVTASPVCPVAQEAVSEASAAALELRLLGCLQGADAAA